MSEQFRWCRYRGRNPKGGTFGGGLRAWLFVERMHRGEASRMKSDVTRKGSKN